MNNIPDLFRQVKDDLRCGWRGELQRWGIDSAYLTGRHTACPICGGKDSFRFDDKNGDGSWFCNNCKAGDGIALLSNFTGKTPLEVAMELLKGGRLPANHRSPAVATEDNTDLSAKNKGKRDETWAKGHRLYGTSGWQYLLNRGLPLTREPLGLRYSDRETTKIKDGTWHHGPAILVAFTDITGRLTAVQRIFITPGGRKALGAKSKRFMLGNIEPGGSVKLYEPAERLGIAEGIENAIACYVATGIPTWASLSAGLMQSVVIPPAVREVVIFGDHDEEKNGKRAGQDAAEHLGTRLIQEGKTVKILLPPEAGRDWLDMVTQEHAP